jgi:hypothetical protein
LRGLRHETAVAILALSQTRRSRRLIGPRSEVT